MIHVVHRHIPKDMGVAADQLGDDALHDVGQLKAPLLYADLHQHGDQEHDIPQLLDRVGVVLGIQSLQQLAALVQEICPQTQQGLRPIPGAAFGRAQMGDDLLQVSIAAVLGQGGHVEGGQVIEVPAPVQFVEGEGAQALGRGAGGVDHGDGMVRRVGVEQGQLHIPGQEGAVELGHQQGQAVLDPGVALLGQEHGIHDLAAIHGVHAHGGKAGLDEAGPAHHPGGETSGRGPIQDQPGGLLPHPGVAGDGVDHATRFLARVPVGQGQVHHSLGNGRVDVGEGLVLSIEIVAALPDHIAQRGHAGMALRAQHHPTRPMQRPPSPQGDLLDLPRSQAYDCDVGCRVGHIRVLAMFLSSIVYRVFRVESLVVSDQDLSMRRSILDTRYSICPYLLLWAKLSTSPANTTMTRAMARSSQSVRARTSMAAATVPASSPWRMAAWLRLRVRTALDRDNPPRPARMGQRRLRARANSPTMPVTVSIMPPKSRISAAMSGRPEGRVGGTWVMRYPVKSAPVRVARVRAVVVDLGMVVVGG